MTDPPDPCPTSSDEARACWVIDAMNVIGSRPDGWWRDRDAAVRRLVDQLRGWASDRGIEVLVVADGRPLPDLPEGVHDGVEVRYAARSGPDAADDRIVELLPDLGGTPTLVTADRELRRRAEALGAQVHGPGALRSQLDAHGRRLPSPGPDPEEQA